MIMNRSGLSIEDRKVAVAARNRAKETGAPAFAIELADGRIVTGRTGSMVGAAAGALANALKTLADIPEEIDLIAPIVLQPIRDLKTKHFGSENPRLHSDEFLYALSISGATNPMAAQALKQLPKLRGCEAHSSVILSHVDTDTYRHLGLNCTCEPERETNRLFIN